MNVVSFPVRDKPLGGYCPARHAQVVPFPAPWQYPAQWNKFQRYFYEHFKSYGCESKEKAAEAIEKHIRRERLALGESYDDRMVRLANEAVRGV